MGDRQLYSERLAYGRGRDFVRREARPRPRDEPHARAFYRGGPEWRAPRVDWTYHQAVHADGDVAAAGTGWYAHDGGFRGIRGRGIRNRHAAYDCRRAEG